MSVQVISVKAELRTDSNDVATATPRLSWVSGADGSDWMQASAEIELDGGDRAIVEGNDSVLVDWPFALLLPRERRTVRVRVTGMDGVTSAWSDAHEIVAAFLADGEWSAPMIGLASPAAAAQPVLMRTTFELRDDIVRATLYATAHGAYDAFVNGTDVDDQFMKPGWTPYPRRLIHESTDVTSLVAAGSNALGLWVAGAWFTERYGFRADSPPFYGTQPAAAAQLHVQYADGSTQTVVSDSSWVATAEGPLVQSSLYDGDHYDARRELPDWASADFDDSGWTPVAVVGMPVTPSARTSPAVRPIEQLAVREVLTSASGQSILDFGQNLVGRLRIRVSGPAGTVVTLRHAEVLEHGELGTRPLRTAEATDVYILRGGGDEVWEPRFTFHGFRYAQVTGLTVAAADVSATVIHSDMRRTGWFTSSDPLLNRFHENVVWGMRGNFLYLPTDCPQRDERLGWTGDIQVFAPTASFLYDSAGFLESWLVDLALEQEATGTGSVPFVVPNVLWDAHTPAAAWGDAATVVPSVLHERFGDRGVLRAQLPSMRAWADHLLGLAGERYLWEGGFQFGDWLDPTAPPEDAARAKTDPDIVASAYLYRSVALVAHAADALGETAIAQRYASHAESVRGAFVAEYVTGVGRLLSDAPTAYAVAIVFGLVDSEQQRFAMGARLAELVRRDGYRIATGFVGTPVIADALTSTGHLAVAGRLLMQTKSPSWLHPVTMGATTVWERWDSMLADGTINPGEMTSFNHYALGAVADWLHRSIAGLAPAAPGCRVLSVAPKPIEGLDWAEASLETPYGLARVAWKRHDGDLVVDAVIPANTTAQVHLPGSDEVLTVGSGAHSWRMPTEAPSSRLLGTFTTLADVIDDESVFAAVSGAIASDNEELSRRFATTTRWSADLPLSSALSGLPDRAVDLVEAALNDLNVKRGLNG